MRPVELWALARFLARKRYRPLPEKSGPPLTTLGLLGKTQIQTKSTRLGSFDDAGGLLLLVMGIIYVAVRQNPNLPLFVTKVNLIFEWGKTAAGGRLSVAKVFRCPFGERSPTIAINFAFQRKMQQK